MSAGRATIVLVHGAWHGIWCWERLAPHLEERGLTARTLDLPSVHAPPAAPTARGAPGGAPGLVEDAAAVRSVLDSLAGPVVLCGHSYAGMVISLAAAGHRRVSRLIYLAAFVPEEGQSLVALGGNRHAPWVRMLGGDMTLPDLARAGEVLYGDCDPATREWALARLKPQHALAFTQPVPRPAWREIPSTYIVCKQDAAIPPEWQRNLFAPRAGQSFELDAGHSAFLSQPAALAHVLAEVMGGLGRL